MINKGTNLSLIILLVSVLWVSCKRSSEPCFQPKTVNMIIGTYKPADTGTAGVDSTLPKALITIPDSNFALYKGANQSKFVLLLSPKSDSIRYYFSTDSTFLGSDTVTFYYQRNLTFLSTSCGYTFHYVLQSVKNTSYNIDSVKIVNGNIDGTANIEHVKIFY